MSRLNSKEGGIQGWLVRLPEELRTKRYRPQAVRRVYIPKANGKLKPLGMPTIKDRVAQMAALLILEPDPGIDLRIGLSGLLVRVPAMAEYASGAGGDQRALQEGYQAVYDADLKSYCDTISHEKLLACLRHRMADRSVLGLIRMWLEAVVVEEGERTEAVRSGSGMRKGRHKGE